MDDRKPAPSHRPEAALGWHSKTSAMSDADGMYRCTYGGALGESGAALHVSMLCNIWVAFLRGQSGVAQVFPLTTGLDTGESVWSTKQTRGSIIGRTTSVKWPFQNPG